MTLPDVFASLGGLPIMIDDRVTGAVGVSGGAKAGTRKYRPFGDLKVGERGYTIGNPRGFERTLGEGLISGLRSTRRELGPNNCSCVTGIIRRWSVR